MKMISSSLLSPRRLLRPWLLTTALICWATAGAWASQAIIHFQVGDAKEDQLVTIDLFDANAPQTVANFKSLVAKKFYNTLPAEIGRKHVRGSVAMAALPPTLNPARLSNGSQFYIMLRPMPELDKDYTVFGQVTQGLEFLDSISRRGRDTNDYPLEKLTIRSIEVR